MPGDILSIPEAAGILGISRIAVFKRVKSGAIPAFRVGRSWAISREDLPAARGRLNTKQLPPPPAGETRRTAKRPPPAPPPPTETPEGSEDLDSMGWD